MTTCKHTSVTTIRTPASVTTTCNLCNVEVKSAATGDRWVAKKPSPQEAIELSGYRATSEFDDGGYSALHRPGSWEWQLEQAAEARGVLKSKGYRPVEGAEKWLVRWEAVDDAPRDGIGPYPAADVDD